MTRLFVAAAVLAASGFIEPQLLRNVMVVGPSLNGEVRSVSGVLPKSDPGKGTGMPVHCIIPFENLAKGALVKDMKVVGVQNIKEVLKLVSDPDAFGKENPVFRGKFRREPGRRESGGFREICGQESARRAAGLQSADFTTSCLSTLRALGRPCLPKEYLRLCSSSYF